MTSTVSVVIPTVGRPTLARAVHSALTQSRPVSEIIVVADTDQALDLSVDPRITVLPNNIRVGPRRSRQLGVEAARGSVIAFLDDDDEWSQEKLERQLAVVRPEWGAEWILSSRVAVMGPGGRRRTWPTRLIEPGQPVADYLFRRLEIGVGGAVLQTSTLVCPTELARRVRWDSEPDMVHDEPTWLMEIQRVLPEVRISQLPDVLTTYHVADESLSRSRIDCTEDYIDWGLRHLSTTSPRVRGDYLCTSPVSAAVSAQSLTGVAHAVRSALSNGRPGPFALTYAALNAVRIAVRRMSATGRR